MASYISNTPNQIQDMLKSIGVKEIGALFKDIPKSHAPKSFDLPNGLSEQEVVSYLQNLANQNASGLSLFVGAGYYDHYVPPVVAALISRGEFLTAYTPYQPECSQGTLQALYEYQSSMCALTGMEVSNASLYDGGTALYEAMMMALRITGRNAVILDGGVSPIYRTIIHSYTKNLNIEFLETPVVHGQSNREAIAKLINEKTAAVIVQNPNFFGAVDDHSDIVTMAHDKGALVIQSVYPIALGMLKTPGEMDVDIVTGEGQSLGLPLSFGGPYLGFMTTKKAFVRKMPGRIVGETVDADGKRCFVNTLQAREQHIRREKATSNICTNVSLCAIQAGMYMNLLGRQGIKELAELNFQKSEFFKDELNKLPGVEVKRSAPTFNEFTVALPKPAQEVVEAMIARGFAVGFPLSKYYADMEQYMTVAVTEKRTHEEMLSCVSALKDVLSD